MNKDIIDSNIIIEDQNSGIDLFDVLFSYLEYKKTIVLSVFLSFFLASLYIVVSKSIKEYTLEFTLANNLQFILSTKTINKIDELGFGQESIQNHFKYNLTNIMIINKSADNMLKEDLFTMDKSFLVNDYLKNIEVFDNKIVLSSSEANEELIKNLLKAHTEYNSKYLVQDLLASLMSQQKALEVTVETIRKQFKLNHSNKTVKLEDEIENYKLEVSLMNLFKLKKINNALVVAKKLGITNPIVSTSTQDDFDAVVLNFDVRNIGDNNSVFDENVPPYYLGSFLLEKIIEELNTQINSNLISTTRWVSLQSELEGLNNSISDAYIEGLVSIQNKSEEISNVYSEIESIISKTGKNPFLYYDPEVTSINVQKTNKITILYISIIVGFIFSFMTSILHKEYTIRKNKVVAQDY